MPRNIKLQIEYDGSRFLGWQKQVRQPTIQQTIEKALQKILRHKVYLVGSGRTDAGVHALAQVANFQTDSEIPADKLRHALNGVLPEDIVVTSVKEARPDFHSRFQAKSKIYRYSILNRQYSSALSRGKVYFCSYDLDLKLMQKEAKALLGKHDFKAFCASASCARNAIRTIKQIKLAKKSDLITLDIEADGFLYNMVRNIVGTLIEIGRGKMPAGSMKKILASRNRKLCGPTAPACGLCLVRVRY